MLRGALLLTLALSAMEVRCWGWMQNLLLHDATLHRDLQKQLRPRFLWSSKNLDYFDVDDDDKKKTSNAKSQRDYGTRKSDKGYSEEVEGGGSDNGFVNMSRKQLVSFQKQFSKALLAGIFVLGIGVGVTVDSAINTNPRDLVSRDAIDRNAPSSSICQQVLVLCRKYGSSAMALDSRLFVTFNPFSVHITQGDVKPGCVLRPANVEQVLKRRGLITEEQVQTCKNAMNTWAYVGDLDKEPQLSCVYESHEDQNEFLVSKSNEKKRISSRLQTRVFPQRPRTKILISHECISDVGTWYRGVLSYTRLIKG